ncbi:hypothetical protein [Maridesulfovibrio sp.]|uniref:hypothetical protein n=1 Tax=Maridesulfovibrio sp. TaxID=2795000 RepID=UPI0029F4F7A6|nr:hypothetical protein [Maridesulfovibrio sp.]
MNKHSILEETSEAFKKLEKNNPQKFRSVSKNIAAMVKSLDEQEKSSSSDSETEVPQD